MSISVAGLRLLPVPTLLLLLFLGSCRQSESPEPSPLIVVGDTPITTSEFERSYVNRLIGTGENDTRRNRELHLQNLIDSELLRQHAYDIGLAEVSAAQSRRRLIEKQVLGGVYYERAFLEQLEPPTDAEIRQAFSLWKQKAIVRHLFYRDSSDADAAYDRLESGVPFLKEAQRTYKTATFDSSAGYLGPVGFFEVDPAFSEAAYALEKGEYSEPVRSKFGYHIVLLEDKLVSPLLTESEFQTRREGIASKYRLRKRQLEGDRFIRSFMEERDVRVNAPAIRSLAENIRLIENRLTDPVPELLPDELAAGDLVDLTAETPLAWFGFDGREFAFTLEDYALWFDELPFPEARYRTAASVGRALRNEVLARAAESEGLGDDPEVLDEIRYLERFYLAQRVRELIHRADTIDVPEDELRDLAVSTGLQASQEIHADYWLIPFVDRHQAEEALKQIHAGEAAPDTFSGYEVVDARPISEQRELAPQLLRAPPGIPVLTTISEGDWSILNVVRRDTVSVSQENREEILDRMRSLLAERKILERLRAETAIRVDTTQFQTLANLDR